ITMAYHRHHGLQTRIMRIFNTYGTRMRLDDGRVLPAFIGQSLRNEALTVFGDGSQTRSFCYVDDLLEGAYRLMQSDEVFPTNIGNPTEMTILEFAQRVQESLGVEREIVFHDLPTDDPKVRQPDITKANGLLDWSPQIELAEGLKLTIPFFRDRVSADTN
ncbi:MAG: NAD-dependent dehydratase, partial [Planctomycetota bacterium]